MLWMWQRHKESQWSDINPEEGAISSSKRWYRWLLLTRFHYPQFHFSLPLNLCHPSHTTPKNLRMFQNLFCSLHKYLLLWLPRMYESCLGASLSTARFDILAYSRTHPGISYCLSPVLSVSATLLSPYRLTNYVCPTAQKKYFQEGSPRIWITCNHQTTRRHTPEDSDLNIHCHERLNLIPLPSSLGFLYLLCSNVGIYSSTSTQRCFFIHSVTATEIKRQSYVYWTVHHCDSWRIKDQLDVTCYFVSLLMCSTCFGH